MSQCQKVFILLLLGGALVCRQGEQPEQTKGETGGEDFRTVQKDGKPDTKEVSFSFRISRQAVGLAGRLPGKRVDLQRGRQDDKTDRYTDKKSYRSIGQNWLT